MSDTVVLPEMPLLSISSKDTVQKCKAFSTRPSDIFICSYPKSGTTWMQHIVLSLLVQHERNISSTTIPDYKHVSDYAPFFEIDAHWNGAAANDELSTSIQQRQAQLGTRVFNTHLRFEMLPIADTTTNDENGARYIYVMRDPLDACVSFYHHLSHQVQGGYDGEFDEFYQEWLSGELPFGSWMHHVLSYCIGISKHGQVIRTMGESVSSNDNADNITARRTTRVDLLNGSKLLLVSYQSMLNHLDIVVKEIQDFLELTTISPQQREEMVETFSFDSMKREIQRFQPKSVDWKHNFSFLRRGISGDAANKVSKKQAQEFEKELTKCRFQETIRQLLQVTHSEVLRQVEELPPQQNQCVNV